MFNLKLKQIQCAISDGLLDKAYELSEDEKIKSHRKGQKLTALLARKLVKRGNEHLADNRLSQALNDCNKADSLGGNQSEIAELRKAICKSMEDRQYKHQINSQQLGAAQLQIDNGFLSVGEKIIDKVEHPKAEILRNQAGNERIRIDILKEKIKLALGRNDLTEAVSLMNRVLTDAKSSQDIAHLKQTILSRVSSQANEYLTSGRIDLAEIILGKINDIADDSIEIRQLTDALCLCRLAASNLSMGKLRDAYNCLAKLRIILPEADWLKEALSEAQTAAQELDNLQTGPLGLISTGTFRKPQADETIETEEIPLERPEQPQEKKSNMILNTSLPSKFILQIDGVGGYMAIRDSVVTMGPISSSDRPTIALMAQAHLPTAAIERHEQDYFLKSNEPIHIADRAVSQKLLRDGDKIALDMRCRMKFNLPNAASSTATLMMSSARLPRPDINHIILMDREILIGPGLGNHVRTNDLSSTAALYSKNGNLYCRTDEPLIIDGKSCTRDTALPMDKPIQIGRMFMVLANLKGQGQHHDKQQC